MDPIENSRAVAQELVCIAQKQGVDLESLRNDDLFIKDDRRWIWFWRKDSLPATGPAKEPLETLHYNMQGSITELPSQLKESASIFRGRWHETGTFENIEQAVELVKAWLIDQKEVDDLPRRSVRSYGI